jgi:hypothetical protein
MILDTLILETRRRDRQRYPLLAEPGNAVVCLSDGAAGTIVTIEDLAGQLAYRVEMQDGTMRHILSTHLDTPPLE